MPPSAAARTSPLSALALALLALQAAAAAAGQPTGCRSEGACLALDAAAPPGHVHRCAPVPNGTNGALGCEAGGVVCACTLAACSAATRFAPRRPRALPSLLMAGDHVSGELHPHVFDALADEFDAYHSPDDAATAHDAARCAAHWLGARPEAAGPWDVAVLNFGRWDAGDSRLRLSEADYAAQLRAAVEVLKARARKVMWVTSAPPRNATGYDELAEDRGRRVRRYNEVAAAVMADAGVASHDLHAAATLECAANTPWGGECEAVPSAKHGRYTHEGAALLAATVTQALRDLWADDPLSFRTAPGPKRSRARAKARKEAVGRERRLEEVAVS